MNTANIIECATKVKERLKFSFPYEIEDWIVNKKW